MTCKWYNPLDNKQNEGIGEEEEIFFNSPKKETFGTTQTWTQRKRKFGKSHLNE